MKNVNIKNYKERFHELKNIINDVSFYKENNTNIGILINEYKYLDKLINIYDTINHCLLEKQFNEKFGKESNDHDLCEIAKLEITNLEQKINKLKKQFFDIELKIQNLSIENNSLNKNDKNIILEIRAGTGGSEACLFVVDLYKMYKKYAEKKSWKTEILISRPADIKGFKELNVLISGNNVFEHLQYESGVHRVQRIPLTESQGRIHTSTATVAILPEAKEVEVNLNMSDLEINISRASGPGGQSVNTTDSAVKILHKPTGLNVYCADERSQQKNKLKALKVLTSRLLHLKKEQEAKKYSQNRRNQIGTGDRSERIRTYNFQQRRITDHRVNYSIYNFDEFLNGHLDELILIFHKTLKNQ